MRNGTRAEKAFKEAWNGLQSARHVLNGTARIARAAHTEVVSNETKPQSLSDVKPGDVLVSHPTAVLEHEISIFPNAPHEMPPTHDAAIREERSEADAMGVDAQGASPPRKVVESIT